MVRDASFKRAVARTAQRHAVEAARQQAKAAAGVRPSFDALAARELSPTQILKPLQLKFINDDSRFKIGVCTRQWGKSTVTAGEAVRDCLRNPGTTWICMSSGERQAVEWLKKAKMWIEAYQYVIANIIEDRDASEALLKSAEIIFANGSRIIAIPANPATARGLSGNVIFDEFAYHEQPDLIWAAAFPFASNDEAGTFSEKWKAFVDEREFVWDRVQKIRVVSTFNGQNNKFFELVSGAVEGKNEFSYHKITIDDAIADGHKLNKEALRKNLADDDRFAEEYECIPLNSSAVLLPYELIKTCEDEGASQACDSAIFYAKRNLYMGIDFARENRDLSVAFTFEKIGDVLWTREIHVMRSTPTPDQVEQLRHRIAGCKRVSVDYTGGGIGLGDYLVKEFKEYDPGAHKAGKIELMKFTNALKNELFPRLRTAFEDRRVRIPHLVELREDLHSVNRGVTANGSITYFAPTLKGGHADRCTAMALAVHASHQEKSIILPSTLASTPARLYANARREKTLY